MIESNEPWLLSCPRWPEMCSNERCLTCTISSIQVTLGALANLPKFLPKPELEVEIKNNKRLIEGMSAVLDTLLPLKRCPEETAHYPHVWRKTKKKASKWCLGVMAS